MKTSRKVHATRTIALALLLAACGPESGPGQPSAAPSSATSGSAKPATSGSAVARALPPLDRKTAPKASGEVKFVAPKVEEAKLSNGIRVLIVEQTGLPIVGVNVSTNVGAESSSTPGLGALTAAMLMRGTATRDAIKLGDDIEAIGANVEAFGDFDTIGVGGKCLTSTLPAMLEIMADVAMNPAFDEKELGRERSRRLTIVKTQVDRPTTLLANAINEVLYPTAHPYAKPLIGTEASLGKITRDDLVAYHAARLEPSHVTISVAGSVTKATVLPALEKAFGSWKTGEQKLPAATLDAKRPEKSPRVLLIDRPDAPQSSMMFVALGVPRTNPDYDAITVMNTILGGQFSSRLNLNLREAHAYTYGAGSRFDFRHGAGPFSAGGEIVREKTGAAAKEILAELARLRDEKVTAEELADAKSTLIDSLPARFETAGATAGSFAGIATYGLPLDEFATRPARWSKVTAEDVQRVAKQYLLADEFVVVVVGDAAVVKTQLEELKLGDVVVRGAAK